MPSPPPLRSAEVIGGDDAFRKKMSQKTPIKEGKVLIGWKSSPPVKQIKIPSLYWNYQLLGAPRIIPMFPNMAQRKILKGGRKKQGRISAEARNVDKENR